MLDSAKGTSLDRFERMLEILRAESVLMMEAYFDESGTHKASPVVCIAGYLFTTEQARHLNREWADTLADFGVTIFHASECGNGRGEFQHLLPERRNELTKRIIGIIRRRMEAGFAVTMSETDFHQTPAPTWVKGGPYMICAMCPVWHKRMGQKKFLRRGNILFF
jgi:hypothetical protein